MKVVLNGDIGLIPVSSQAAAAVDFCPVPSSPPTRDDTIHKIMTEWNHIVNIDNTIDLAADMSLSPSPPPPPDDLLIVTDGFDLTKYIDQSPIEEPKPRTGGKRIDMANMRYVIDESANTDSEEESTDNSEDEDITVDVETISDPVTQPVLQAGDLKSLLEQFEATESTNMEIHHNLLGQDIFDDSPHQETLTMQISPPNQIPSISDSVNINICDADISMLSAPLQSDFPVDLPCDIPTTLEIPSDIDIPTTLEMPTDIDIPTSFDMPLDIEIPSSLDIPSSIEIPAAFDIPSAINASMLSPVASAPPAELEVSPARVNQSTDTDDELPCMSPVKIQMLSPIKTPKRAKVVPTEATPPQKTAKSTQNVKVPVANDSIFSTPTKDEVKSKQILDSLPPELINRIRQSCKRKPVPVIAPIVPAKKRLLQQPKESKSIQLDHDYCTNTPRKDSGFSSCEEDDRSIVRSQPTVKNADGKLMVSLLKTNTIKKKLNLEEYKKRLQTRKPTDSGNNSPGSEDTENNRRLKHQAKLLKEAHDIVLGGDTVVEEKPVEVVAEPELPPNMVMKTLVSVGTNTEESWGHLEQILQNTKIKISPNSLISSIVEHLPKVKPVIIKQVEHGEDKTIVYLDKAREKPKMTTVHVQTIHSSAKRRNRSSSSSSCSSDDSSCSSTSSRSRDSRSRSRTPSPVRRRQKEQIKVVEERRVIYVGRIADSVTREDLRRRFSRFGPITNVSVHFRRRADNYGFVTFVHKEDAYEALEGGNSDPNQPQYDLSFGGRRLFCQTTYADLDNVKDDQGYWSPITGTVITLEDNTFDVLLRQAQEKLRQRQL